MNIHVRNCPKCQKELNYKSKSAWCNANRRKSICYTCGRKSEASQSAIRKTIEDNINSERFKGENNPFYGKKHTIETIKKIKDNGLFLSGEKSPMYGKSVYSVWIKKYGIEVANQKMIELKKKQSFNSSGERNPMFGKPSPKGSGNGWSGWYKGLYFRSLLELSFMVQNDGLYQTCESKKYKIQYSIENKIKNYFPDFIINDIVYEIKPKKLQKTFLNKIKFEAAEKWCKENNLVFSVLDPKRLKFDDIVNLVEKEQIIFTEKYKIKYNEYYKRYKIRI